MPIITEYFLLIENTSLYICYIYKLSYIVNIIDLELTNCFLYKYNCVTNNEQLYVPIFDDYIFQEVVF